MLLDKKNGFALIWSVIMVTIVLVVGATVATAITNESRMALNTADSLRAYAAAQSGVEIAKKYINLNTNLAFSGSVDGASYNVTYVPNGLVESTGTVGDINRKIEYDPSMSAPLLLTDTDISKILSGNASLETKNNFTFSFDFWGSPGSGSQTVTLANPNNSTDKSKIDITYNISSKNLSLNVTDNNGSKSYPSTPLTLPSAVSPYYSYNISISYVKNAYLRYRLTSTDVNFTKTCTAGFSGYIDLSQAAVDLTNSPKLSFSPVASLSSSDALQSFWLTSDRYGGMSTFSGTGIALQ